LQVFGPSRQSMESPIGRLRRREEAAEGYYQIQKNFRIS
jgi:hypothetical protein